MKDIIFSGRLDKASLKNRAAAIANGVKAGIDNPIEVLAAMKFIEKCCQDVQKEIKDDCMSEIYNHPGKKAMVAGMEIHLRESGVNYDFSNTPRWVEINREIEKLVESRKALEKILMALTEPQEMPDKDTGEMVELNPPVRTSGESLFCTPK